MNETEKLSLRFILAWVIVLFLSSGIASADGLVLWSDKTHGRSDFNIRWTNPGPGNKQIIFRNLSGRVGPDLPFLQDVPGAIHAYHFDGTIKLSKITHGITDEIRFQCDVYGGTSIEPYFCNPVGLGYGAWVGSGVVVEIDGTVTSLVPGFLQLGEAQIVAVR